MLAVRFTASVSTHQVQKKTEDPFQVKTVCIINNVAILSVSAKALVVGVLVFA